MEPKQRSKNPFIEFYPFEKTVRELERQGDGPPTPSVAQQTLRPGSRPGDAPPKKKLQEDIYNVYPDDPIRRYLNKRRMYWLYRIDESSPHRAFLSRLRDFSEYASSYLDLKTFPRIRLYPTLEATTFASWSPEGIELSVANRHPLDIFRSLAHELVHHKQHENDVLHAESGVTGSDHENEANALAGIMMRNYGQANPELFKALNGLAKIEEGFMTNMLFGSGKKSNAKPVKELSPKQKKAEEDAAMHAKYKEEADRTERFVNDPKNQARFKAEAEAKRAAEDKVKMDKHKEWLDNEKKHPLPTSAPGTKTFSNILDLKKVKLKEEPMSKSNIDKVLKVLETKKNWNQIYDVVDEQITSVPKKGIVGRVMDRLRGKPKEEPKKETPKETPKDPEFEKLKREFVAKARAERPAPAPAKKEAKHRNIPKVKRDTEEYKAASKDVKDMFRKGK